MNETFGELDYGIFCRKVERAFGLVLSDYKPDQMRRRLTDIARQYQTSGFAPYFALLEKDTDALASFMDQVTINVTELIRNPNTFEKLFKEILPLVERERLPGTLSVWSAGCSYGAEAYSMAMLLHESNPLRAFKIKGTDVDPSILAKANMATFSAADMQNVSDERRSVYFNTFDGKAFSASAKLRNCVSFSRHDLLADSYPEATYDLILCRNVLIYFTEAAQQRVFEGFFQSLKPGGVLFIGGTERISNPQRIGFDVLQPFFYQKPVRARMKMAA